MKRRILSMLLAMLMVLTLVPSSAFAAGESATNGKVDVAFVIDSTGSMGEEIANVKTGQITYAVRDTVIDDKEIKCGDYMGIGDKTILSVGGDRDDTLKDMIAQLMDEDAAIISLYYGEEVTEEEAEEIGAYLEETYPDVDVEVEFGGQPIYYYIISVE